jgi:hypothetical protein
LQAAAGDEVSGTGILGHIERVLVTHVDDRGAYFDAAGSGPDGGQQRKGRGELTGEMVRAKIGPVGAKLLGSDRQLDGLKQRIRG